MATEQNHDAQDLQQEQAAEQETAQTQAGTEQNEVSVESLQEQIAQLEGDLKLEKARTEMQCMKHKKVWNVFNVSLKNIKTPC